MTNILFNIKWALVVYGIICKTSIEKTFGILCIIFRGTQILVLKANKETVHLQLEIKDIFTPTVIRTTLQKHAPEIWQKSKADIF